MPIPEGELVPQEDEALQVADRSSGLAQGHQTVPDPRLERQGRGSLHEVSPIGGPRGYLKKNKPARWN